MLGTIWETLLYGPIHNLLTYLYVVTGSIGISTFILIIIIRLFMWPMVAKQYRDTKKIRSIQPKLDDIKEKYKNNPTELAKAQQAVYKDANYNPLGCVTNLLIQFPILIALYQSVLAFTKEGVTPANMTGLYPFVQEKLLATGQTAFATDLFGITLISSPGSALSGGIFTVSAIPYLILLLLLGLSNLLPTLVSMKIMNTQVPKLKKKGAEKTDAEAMQEAFTSSLNTSTLYVMPIMITLTLIPLPSIIAVYMVAQNLISTTQQLLVKFVHDIGLKKKLIPILIQKYSFQPHVAEETAAKLIKVSPAINFLVDELGNAGKIDTTSVKIHDITFEKVLQKVKNDTVKALFIFDKMARKPAEAEQILKDSGK